MYDRILLPTDGSPAMGSTVEQCIHQARTNDTVIHALYVVDVRAYLTLPDDPGKRVAELLEEEGRSALDAIRTQAEAAELEVVTDLVVGVPHEAILAYAVEQDIDLIVMGTHGQTGDRRIVGSVAEEVVRSAEMPVLTVRMSEMERQQVDEAVPEEQQRYIR